MLLICSVLQNDLQELKEYDTVQQLMDLSSTSDNIISIFSFQSNWTDYQGETKDNDYGCITLSLDQDNVNKLLQYNIDLQILISSNEKPTQENAVVSFNMTDFISVNEDNEIISKTNQIFSVPQNEKMYIQVNCQGTKCTSANDYLYYYITVNSISKIEDYQQTSPQYIQLREDGVDQSFYMTSQNTDLINVLLQQFNTIDGGTNVCDDYIQNVTVTICVGVMPLLHEIQNTNQLQQCQQYTSETIDFELDSQNVDVSTGTIYARIQTTTKTLIGISQCQTEVKLYRNQYLDPSYQSTRVSGDVRTEQNPYHFYADVPGIQMEAASADGSTYGDRLILQLTSNQPVTVCISDQLTNFYPTLSGTVDTCTLYKNMSTPGINQTVLNFGHYLNKRVVGNMNSFTRVYVTVFASDNSSNSVQSLTFNITLCPQVYVDIDQYSIFTWQSKQKHGVSDYIALAFDVRKITTSTLELIHNSSVLAGYYCDYSFCRENIPDSFYLPSIATFISQDNMIPNMNNLTGVLDRNVDGGVQVVGLDNITMSDIKEIYAGVQNRLGESNYNNAFASRLFVLYGSQNELQYQKATSVRKLTGQQVIDYYHALIPYQNTELVVYPCRGWPAVLIDSVTPDSLPQDYNYEQQLVNEWGKPITYHWQDSRIKDVNQFITVYDYSSYDDDIQNFIGMNSQMQYQIFVGSQAEENVPGNQGQIVIVKYDRSGDGTLTVRFYPARQANQVDDVSSVNYYLYVVPYQGSFNTHTDFTPYTKCGVQSAGYSVYSDEQGNERIIIDNSQLEEKGYIEVTNNLPLYQRNSDKDTILYVNVFAANNGYQGVLIGKTELTIGTLMGISVAVMIVIVLALVIIFYSLYYKELKRKSQGYNEVL